jgi:hypothetical protein
MDLAKWFEEHTLPDKALTDASTPVRTSIRNTWGGKTSVTTCPSNSESAGAPCVKEEFTPVSELTHSG